MRGFSSSITNRFRKCKRKKIDQRGSGKLKKSVDFGKLKRKSKKQRKKTKGRKRRR